MDYGELADVFLPSDEDFDMLSLFTQAELKDLVRDLYLPKMSAMLLASKLKEK